MTTDKAQPAPAVPSLREALELLQEAVDLCAIGDIDETTDDGLGWAGFVRDEKAMLAARCTNARKPAAWTTHELIHEMKSGKLAVITATPSATFCVPVYFGEFLGPNAECAALSASPPAAVEPTCSGMQAGETIQQAAERWAWWCERRGHATGLPVFLRFLARAWEAAVATPSAPPEADALDAAQTQAARDVLAERRRQVEKEGWTFEHDDEHDNQEMALAAVCYAFCYARPQPEWMPYGGPKKPPPWWPWGSGWWRPKSPRRDLIKAGALILAEIERLDRASKKDQA